MIPQYVPSPLTKNSRTPTIWVLFHMFGKCRKFPVIRKSASAASAHSRKPLSGSSLAAVAMRAEPFHSSTIFLDAARSRTVAGRLSTFRLADTTTLVSITTRIIYWRSFSFRRDSGGSR